MAAIHETAYPRIKPNLSRKELQSIFTSTEAELCFLNSKTKKTIPVTRLGFMLTLKCYQYLGRPVSIIDFYIIKFIADYAPSAPQALIPVELTVLIQVSILIAAFTLRSCNLPQAHVHSRSFNVRSLLRAPQPLQSFI